MPVVCLVSNIKLQVIPINISYLFVEFLFFNSKYMIIVLNIKLRKL